MDGVPVPREGFILRPLDCTVTCRSTRFYALLFDLLLPVYTGIYCIAMPGIALLGCLLARSITQALSDKYIRLYVNYARYYHWRIPQP